MIARRWRTLLLAAIFSLWGCQPTVYLMPAPVGLAAEQGLNGTPEREMQKDTSVIIGYATNRLPDKRDKPPFYTKKFDDTLRFGVATVQIGKEAKRQRAGMNCAGFPPNATARRNWKWC